MEKINDLLKLSISQRFKVFRESLNINQSEMGKLLDLSQSTITGIEKGKSFPTIPTIITLMENCNLNVKWLLTGEGDMLLSESVEKEDFGPDDEKMQEFLFYLRNVEMVRYRFLSDFIGYKEQHKELIASFLKKNKKVG